MSAPTQHLAALHIKAGSRLEVASRKTPLPGPNEVLIEVNSIALNPIDFYQRNYGFPPITYSPAILGSDIGGIVVSHGPSVSSSTPKPGTRVTAFCIAFYVKGNPDYGAFQKFAIVPEQNICPLPDNVSFNEAATMPMAVGTSFHALVDTLGLPRDSKFTPADKKSILIWGAASSIGTAGVQIAKSMGLTVYATASPKHHDYLKKLGAAKVFDYHEDDVAATIVKAAKEDGMVLNLAYLCTGDTKLCLDVVSEFKVDGLAKLASARPLSEETPSADGVEVKFVQSSGDEAERLEFTGWIFGVWLKQSLEKGTYVASPAIKVIEGGLEGLNAGLDELSGGVSGVKLVLEI